MFVPTLSNEIKIQREPTESYPAAEYCIYCGVRGVTLTDEHIFPFGLGGHYLLPKASCVECQRSINFVETRCMRGMFRAYRIRIGLVGKKKDSVPKTLPLEIVAEANERHRLEIPPISHPSQVYLVKFGPPGALKPIVKPNNFWEPWAYIHDMPALRRAFEEIKNPRTFYLGRFYPIDLCRMLAKISHACMVAEGVPTGFRLLLNDLIRGRADDAALYFVGSINETPPPEPEVPHRVNLVRYPAPNGKEFIVAQIRLFAYLGAPVYEVIIAESA